MAFKTYVPGLILIFKAAHRFATRYQSHLASNLSPAAYTCLLTSIEAIASCLAAIEAPEPAP